VKKPRKSRPKAIGHRAFVPAAALSRVAVLSQAPAHVESVVRSARHIAERRLDAIAGFVRNVTTNELAPRMRRLHAEARALALPYSHDERQALMLLFLPFLLVAYAIVVHQSVRTLQGTIATIAMPEDAAVPVRPTMTRDISLAAVPRSTAREAMPTRTDLATAGAADEARSVADPRLTLAATAPLDASARTVAAPDIGLPREHDRITLAPLPYSSERAAHAETKLALLSPAGDIGRNVAPVSPKPIEVLELDENGKPLRPGICAIDQIPRAVAAIQDARTLDAETFGIRLAQAAESQVGGLVIYNETYRSISYPMGDVPSLFGVCTDVVVRAYRALGLDLQSLVHQARTGIGDTSIDHRRTETLRRFFAKEGESLPVTTFPEDYRPGDIVTYNRPQNRGARAHIAIVSSVMASFGRLMIVHNRGRGPQLEDALFVDEITGHYRYRGPAVTRNAGLPDRPTELAAGTIAPTPAVLPVSDSSRPQAQR
jgi:uncharacterized protein YijF (DUF1287 family)